MIVRSISLLGFMSHARLELALPDRGLVVVTGPNGAGKSSLIEAVAYGCWGKTLRGTDPWQPDRAGSASLAVDRALVLRSVTKAGRKSLEWRLEGRESDRHDTSAKAQAALAEVLGELDLWRRTHVFSSQDAGAFTSASDGERKHLLETMLGLSRFDAAHARARADLHGVEDTVRRVGHSAAMLRERHATLARALAAFERGGEEPAPLEPTAPDPAAMVEASNRVQELGAERGDATANIRAADADRTRAHSDLGYAAGRLRGLDDGIARLNAGRCPTCSAPVVLDRERVRQLEGERAAAAREVERLELAVAEFRAEHRRREEALRQLADTQAGWVEELRRQELAASMHRAWEAAWSAWSARRASWQARADELRRELSAVEADLTEATRHAATAVAEQATMTHVAAALGLRGVRAHVLGQALSGIEAVANDWLARIAHRPLRLRLRPYSATKTAGVNDCISLEVEGAGGGHGYRGASGGERRRIDAALLLALAEVSAAAYGRPPGTIFLDEVFDALDDDGVDAVGAALAELAARRAVVVITHNAALVDRLPAVQRVRVAHPTGAAQED